ncbi:MAG: hypothetical protein K2L18_03830 [Acetatifactor sp.]|nr:hypothetical protein [Acetatifactor sp.]
MKKQRISLWRKIQTYYHYHWMNRDLLFYQPVARPLWFMTHTQEQIDRRTNAYLTRVRNINEKLINSFQEYIDTLQKQKDSRSPSS